MTAAASGEAGWRDAAHAAALVAVDPAGLGGVVVRARPGPVRERWLELVRALVPGRPMPRVPLNVGDDRLVGGLDLAATLRAGRPVVEPGLLATADGGLVVLPMAERIEHGTAARICGVLDTGRVEPGGGAEPAASRFAVLALDESGPDETRPAGGLLDRLGLHLTLDPIPPRETEPSGWTAAAIDAARGTLAQVRVDDEALEAVCAAASSLGIGSLRVPMLALNAARASAALAGRDHVGEADIACAARLVLAPRATALPAGDDDTGDDESTDDSEEAPTETGEEAGEPAGAAEADEQEPAPDSESAETEPQATGEGHAAPQAQADADDDAETEQAPSEALAEVVLAAARAALPEGLLDASRQARAARGAAATAGRAGALQGSGRRGRPAGVRRGEPGPRTRLNVVETLRAAVPWQPVRRAEAGADEGPRIRVRREDLRVTPFRTRSETVTIFVVDASGSAALHRLSEAKGAVELLLADCYVRRDQVALVSFRGTGAEVLLPPTRSLVRAKRQLADLPGGGGTPLAAGIEAAEGLAERVAHAGMTPTVVLLTDGRANVARDGSHDREAAERDAFAAARRVFSAGVTCLLVDTAPRSRPAARDLAAAMGARHLPLPYGDARSLSAVVRGEVA